MRVSFALVLTGCASDPSAFAGPYAVGVTTFEPGVGAGFGQDRLPDVVLGPPHGGGLAMGSRDVLSLGIGGSITLELGIDAIDGPGVDIVVFENPFLVGGVGPAFAEPATVSVSSDGSTFVAFPCAATEAPYVGCAGVAPVLADPERNAIDPTDPALAGGDGFDLALVGVERARFVQIEDGRLDAGFGVDDEGFDLDAVAVVHAAP